ncbi:C40 family peptidase [Mycobacterium deserti]|uniref:NlpC/P60 family protein n=1 Tax=Mycobacterium deserti TaxID=2978347 RepID=A0ABT2MEV7_9MYCO|nr:C40 family peptidase [Mycobacterium deserti]MCT7660807.1 NlpC/P60 family protein [Mycobacterium deserti]
MPGALVAQVVEAIRRVRSTVGPGFSVGPLADPAAALERTRDALMDVSAAARRSWLHAQASWSGSGADAAAGSIASTVAAIDGLAERVDRMSAAAGTASAAVQRADARLRAIADDFEARAAALEPFVDSPQVAQALLAEAQRSLDEAVAVVRELQAELDGHTAALTSEATPASTAPLATAPAGMSAPAMPSMPSQSGGGGGWGSAIGELASLASHPETARDLPDAATFGDGVAIRLPDGSTALAPNATAASAVRHALTQLGVPYEWGGTTPGVGLDCSGLTQWAYGQAGLNIPRLAQEQDIGAAVGAGDLRPGDLAVWDGHVAMVVGNGTMIEAGDPVKLSPIRTDNVGQGFQGFWRPTV